MNSQEMMKCTAKPGYWFVNVAKVDEPPNWVEQIMPETVDVNAPNNIFGYEEKAFLQRQYK